MNKQNRNISIDTENKPTVAKVEEGEGMGIFFKTKKMRDEGEN